MGLWRGLSGGETPRCPGAANRLAFPSLPALSRLAERCPRLNLAVWPPGGPACPSRRRPPRLSPAPCLPGGGGAVASSPPPPPPTVRLVPPCPTPSTEKGRGKAAPAVACRLPWSAAAPLRACRRCGVVALLGARCPVPSPRRGPVWKGAPELPSGSRPAVVICRVAAFSTRLCPGCLVARSPRPPSGPRPPRWGGSGPARPLHGAALAALSGAGVDGPPLPPTGKAVRRAVAGLGFLPCRPPLPLLPAARRPCAARGSRAHVTFCRSLLAALGTRPARVGGDAPRWRALPAHRALLPG